MTFAELLCHVAKLRFNDEAQVGVRVSPVMITPQEALQIPTAARAILAPNTFVAVACPGVDPWEDDRTCVAAGEHAAERATFWRNRLSPQAGDRVLYVSARRLGRAGGLQDTLFDLSESRLRQGFLEWCRSPESGCPPELAEALAQSGVAEVADARALAAFSAAVFDAVDPVRAAGDALPVLSLARDSALATNPEERLRENVRWVRAASAGDSRGVSKLSQQAAVVRRTLTEVTSGAAGDDLMTGLKTVDIGPLKLEELAAPAPKPRSASKPKPPKAPRPEPPTPPRPAPRKPTEERPSESRPRPTAQAEVGEAAPAPAPPGPGGDDPAPDAQATEGSPKEDARATSGAARAGATPAGPAAGASAQHGTAAPADPEAKPSPNRRRPAKVAAGPWTEAMHLRELGAPAPLPEGLRSLIMLALGAPPAEVLWRVGGDDPSRVLLKRPRGLGDPAAPLPPPNGLEQELGAWSAARAALIAALGGVELAVDRMLSYPFTALGAAETNTAAVAAVDAGLRLLEAASTLGAAATEWAIGLDTVCVVSATGGESMVLTPVHPLWLGQIVDRLKQAADAAAAEGPHRTVLAQELARPLATPASWPSRGRTLRPSSPAPGLLGFSTNRRAVAAREVAALTESVVRRYLSVTPHASAGLRVVIDGVDVDAVADGVIAAVAGEASQPSRVWVHASRPVAPSESAGGGPPQTYLPTPTSTEHPHVVVRVMHGEPGEAPGPSELVERYARAINTVGPASGAPVRATSSAVAIAAAAAHHSSDESTWEVLIAPRVRGAPRRGSFVLARERTASSEVVIASRDTRSAARELQGVLEAMGVADTRPKTIRSLVAALASGSTGILSMSATTERQLARLLLEHVLLDHLGDEAAVGHLTEAEQRLWLDTPRDDWGAFAVAAAPRNGRLNLVFGYGAIAGALPAEVLTAGLRRASDVLEAQAASGSFELTKDLLSAMASRSEDISLAALQEAARGGVDLSFACVVPPGHAWASGGRVGKLAVSSTLADRALLERTMMLAGRRNLQR